MLLNARRWGQVSSECIVCVHGLAQHGGAFSFLAKRLAAAGHCVFALDLRGHGGSGHEPPWNTERHVQDVLETMASLGVRRPTLLGHGFGGRVAAATAAAATDSTEALVLLDPALEIPPDRALRGAEADRLRGGEGGCGFSFCPSAVVAAWSEMCLPAPPIATVRTLVVRPEAALFTASLEERYRAALAARFSMMRFADGHNLLCEAAEETARAVECFLEPLPGYVDGSGSLQPLL